MSKSRIGKRVLKKRTPVYDLYEYKPYTRRCNILLFGLSGAGKSSLINNLYSDNEDIEREAAVRAGDHGQCTVKYKKYEFGESVSIFDTWGISYTSEGGTNHSNYPLRSFRAILKGAVDDDHHVEKEIYGGVQQHDRIIDAVIFVLGSEIKDSASSLVAMREHYKAAKDAKVPVFICVTKMDTFMEQLGLEILLEDDPEQAVREIVQSEGWKKLLYFIERNIGDVDAKISPIINYRHGDIEVSDVIHHIKNLFVNTVTKNIDDFYRRGNGGRGGNGGNRCVCRYCHKCLKRKFFGNETPLILNYRNKKERKKLTRPKTSMIIMPPQFVILDTYITLVKLGGIPFRFFYILLQTADLQQSSIIGLFNPYLDNGKSLYFEKIISGQLDPSHKNYISINLLFEAFGRYEPKGSSKKSKTQRSVEEYTFLSSDGQQAFNMYREERTEHLKILFRSKGKSVILTKISREAWGEGQSWVIEHIRKVKENLDKDDRIRKLEEAVETLTKQKDEIMDFQERLSGFVKKLKHRLERVELGGARQASTVVAIPHDENDDDSDEEEEEEEGEEEEKRIRTVDD